MSRNVLVGLAMFVALIAAPSSAFAMDPAAMAIFLGFLSLTAIGIVSGAVMGWLQQPFWRGLMWTFYGTLPLMVAAYVWRSGFDWAGIIALLIVGPVGAAIPLLLSYGCVYGIAVTISRARKAVPAAPPAEKPGSDIQ